MDERRSPRPSRKPGLRPGFGRFLGQSERSAGGRPRLIPATSGELWARRRSWGHTVFRRPGRGLHLQDSPPKPLSTGESSRTTQARFLRASPNLTVPASEVAHTKQPIRPVPQGAAPPLLRLSWPHIAEAALGDIVRIVYMTAT